MTYEDDAVECLGESTRAEAEAARDAAGKAEAIDLHLDVNSEEAIAGDTGAGESVNPAATGSDNDSENEAILGGELTVQALSFDLADMSQSQAI